MSPEQLQRMKDMLAELNHMLEQRERGEEPDFDGFMERYGDFFPGNPQTLDELLEQMAQLDGADAAAAQLDDARAARAAPGARRTSLLDDMDLRWQVDQLGQNLRNAFPQMGWGQRHALPRRRAAAARGMGGLLDQLGDLDALENLLRNATNPGQLAEVDLDQVRELLGDDAARSLAAARASSRRCSRKPGSSSSAKAGWSSRPRASARIGQQALGDLFRKLLQDRAGRHEIERAGFGHERADEHKPYEFGDPFHLDVGQTVKNAITRQGAGTPVRHHARRLRDRAHRAAHAHGDRADARRLALDGDARPLPRRRRRSRWRCTRSSRTQFPRDYLGLVSFGRVAREVKPELLPETSWDFEWGTNMQHALLLARKHARRADRHASRSS